MHSTNAMNRRRFLRQTARVGAALAAFPTIIPARVLGAAAPSKQITIGFIGTGGHAIGWNLPKYLKLPDARILTVWMWTASTWNSPKPRWTSITTTKTAR